jgi:chemotaxis protein CheX
MIERHEIAGFVRVATLEVFSTMLGVEIEAGPERFEDSPPAIADGVLSLVGMAGVWTGAGSISCSALFARRICSLLLMTEADAVNEEVLDAVGEVANMIIGNLKTAVEERVGPIGLSIPTVIYGRNFTSRSIGKNDWVVVPFVCEGEALDIRVCLAPSRESAVSRHGHSNLAAHKPGAAEQTESKTGTSHD